MKALACATLLAASAGCDGPTGPVLGEWRGQMPGPDINAPTAIDLTLIGTPGAPTGHYAITSLTADPTLTTGHGQVAGKTVTLFRLQDILPEYASAYALEAVGKLHPLDPNGQVDASPAGALETLSPTREGEGRSGR